MHDLTGGLERWLYRVVRKHGGRQEDGWSFYLVHLHAKSGGLSPLKHFAYDLRAIVRRQITHDPSGTELLNFAPIRIAPLFDQVSKRGLFLRSSAQTKWTGIADNALLRKEFPLRKLPNLESFGFVLTDHDVGCRCARFRKLVQCFGTRLQESRAGLFARLFLAKDELDR